MVRMSKYKVKESVINEMSELVFELLGKENSKEKFIATLYEVLSPIERLMIGKRLLVMYMIFVGVDYDIIIDVVKVSRATVAKYAFLVDRSIQIKQSLLVTSKKNKLHHMLDELLSSVFEPGISFGNWKTSWRLKRRVQEQKERGF